ncbi:hypothetical protein C808_03320 [Lachnospiraceae bacterium M18-1]|nr:hypothetical protein C808_03320 [Lachnospiraceae bacterium M18-1]
MKMVLVEDKKIALEGMLMVLRKNPKIHVVGTAMDGKNGLELIRQQRPDIVMTDIEMPEMNGLEMIESIYRELPDTVFIVFSGYNEFRYVQKAIGMGVIDYLEKPVTVSKLMEVLQRAEELLDYRKNYHRMIQKTKRTKRILIKQALQQLCTQPSQMEAENIKELLNTAEELQFSLEFTVVCVSTKDMVGETTEIYRALFETFTFDVVKEHTIDIYSFTVDGFFIFCYFNQECYPFDFYQAVSLSYQNFVEAEQLECYAGIGNIHQNIYDLRIAFLEAKKAATYAIYLEKDRIIRCGEVEYSRDIPAELYEIQSSIEFNMRMDSFEKCGELIHQYLERLGKIGLQPERIRQECLELIYILQRISVEDGYRVSQDIIGIPSTEITKIKSADDILKWTENKAERLIRYTSENRQKERNPVAMVKQYINTHYSEGITLNTLAERAGISANYLSISFHREEGVTYSNYLTRVRIKKAMQFLKEGEKLKDVCMKVGYYDYKHFVQQFKKYTGMTPENYKKSPIDEI